MTYHLSSAASAGHHVAVTPSRFIKPLGDPRLLLPTLHLIRRHARPAHAKRRATIVGRLHLSHVTWRDELGALRPSRIAAPVRSPILVCAHPPLPCGTLTVSVQMIDARDCSAHGRAFIASITMTNSIRASIVPRAFMALSTSGIATDQCKENETTNDPTPLHSQGSCYT